MCKKTRFRYVILNVNTHKCLIFKQKPFKISKTFIHYVLGSRIFASVTCCIKWDANGKWPTADDYPFIEVCFLLLIITCFRTPEHRQTWLSNNQPDFKLRTMVCFFHIYTIFADFTWLCTHVQGSSKIMLLMYSYWILFLVNKMWKKLIIHFQRKQQLVFLPPTVQT